MGDYGDYLDSLDHYDPYNVQKRATESGQTYEAQRQSERDNRAVVLQAREVRQQNVKNARWTPDVGMFEDETPIETGANAQMQAAQSSRFSPFFKPTLNPTEQYEKKGQRMDPADPTRLQYVPGAPPDTVFDTVTGDIFFYGKGGPTYGGNLTQPTVTELERGSAVVMGNLTNQGIFAPAKPRALKGDHGWKTKVVPQVPSARDLQGIDVHNPTIEDIGRNLSHESGKIWAQVDRSTKRAMGVGSVIAYALSAGAGAAVAPALAGAMGVTSTLGQAGIAAGTAAAAGGLGMAAGQFAGRGGDVSQIDWGAVARSTITSLAGSTVGAGVNWLGQAAGLSPNVAAGAGQLAGRVTREGVGSILPRSGQNITAYQPYPGMSPNAAQRAIQRAGF
jgi:hypothetical protein